MRTPRLLATAAFVAMMFAGQSAHAVELSHNLALNAGETKTWNGAPRGVGANANYNGLVSEGNERPCTVTSVGDFDYDPRTMCEYALVSVTNPVPQEDLDGKLKKNMIVTIDSFAIPSPFSDFALTLYDTNATGTLKGAELGTSDNTDVPDPDEQVVLSVETTRTEPTKYFLVEVAHFYAVTLDLCALPAEIRPSPCAPYKGTVQF
jgi:hypothetical protein